jgi:ribosomal protein S18 acetylase RimI-like enzyme
MSLPVTFRSTARASDAKAIRRLASAAGNFSAEEIDVAVELVEERLAKGPSSGYEFVFADSGPETVGYVCYGPIACTVGSFDLYWIVVHPSQQGQGLGRKLLAAAEEPMRAAGARRIYIDTSGRADYVATRRFYERCGYQVDVIQRDFYDVGDDRVIFVRDLRS